MLYLHYKSFVSYNMSTALLLLTMLHFRNNNICMVDDTIKVLEGGYCAINQRVSLRSRMQIRREQQPAPGFRRDVAGRPGYPNLP